MQRHLVSWAVFALSAWAQNQGLPVSGPFKAGFARSSEGLMVLEDAGRTPSATSSINFRRTFDNNEEEWTWRVNITEVAVPNRVSDLGDDDADASQGLLVANTQWQLDWPGSDADTLQGLAEMRDAAISFTTLISNKPGDIIDEYSPGDNGDCGPILGEECTESLIEAASRGEPVSFTGLGGCEDTLNTNDGGSDDGASFVVVAPDPEDDVNQRLRREETLFYRTSETYTSDDLTAFDRSLSALQVFIMSFEYDGDETGDTDDPVVLCRIVDASVQMDLEDSEDGDGSEGAAATQGQPLAVLWALVILSLIVDM